MELHITVQVERTKSRDESFNYDLHENGDEKLTFRTQFQAEAGRKIEITAAFFISFGLKPSDFCDLISKMATMAMLAFS